MDRCMFRPVMLIFISPTEWCLYRCMTDDTMQRRSNFLKRFFRTGQFTVFPVLIWYGGRGVSTASRSSCTAPIFENHDNEYYIHHVLCYIPRYLLFVNHHIDDL